MMSRLNAVERGEGPPVVLVHGFGGNHHVWHGITMALGPGVRTIAYDLPGHAGSLDFPDHGNAKLAARAILADLAERGVEKAHIVGHSMGGAVAVLMGLAAPDSIASLTLLAPGGFGEAINGPLLRRFAKARSAQELAACLTAMSAHGTSVSHNAVETDAALRAQPGQTERLEEIAAMITRNDVQGVIPRDMMATLAMPVTVIWGTEDPVLPFSQSEGLPAHFELCVLPGAGHMLIDEAPDVIADLIRARL